MSTVIPESPVRRRGLYIAGSLLILLLVLLWFVRGILTPFIVAIALAAIMDPMLVKLQRRGLARIYSVLIVYFGFFIVLTVFLMWMVPLLISEAKSLATNWPEYYVSVKDSVLKAANSDIARRLPVDIPHDVSQLSNTVSDYLGRSGQKLLNNLIGGLVGTVSAVLNTFIVLIATFYLMNDWPRIRRRIHYLIPPQFRDNVVSVGDRVGTVFTSYLRGLTTLCVTYGVVCTIMLILFGVNYAFLLGLLATILYAVPYVGAAILALVAGVVAFVSMENNIVQAFIVVGSLLALNSLVFDPILTPRILGKSTGLHPLLSLFAILAGSEMLGFIGFIIGVPIAASLGVVAVTLYPRLAEQIPDSADVPSEEPEPEEEPSTPIVKTDPFKDSVIQARSSTTVDDGKDSAGSQSSDG